MDVSLILTKTKNLRSLNYNIMFIFNKVIGLYIFCRFSIDNKSKAPIPEEGKDSYGRNIKVSLVWGPGGLVDL